MTRQAGFTDVWRFYVTEAKQRSYGSLVPEPIIATTQDAIIGALNEAGELSAAELIREVIKRVPPELWTEYNWIFDADRYRTWLREMMIPDLLEASHTDRDRK